MLRKTRIVNVEAQLDKRIVNVEAQLMLCQACDVHEQWIWLKWLGYIQLREEMRVEEAAALKWALHVSEGSVALSVDCTCIDDVASDDFHPVQGENMLTESSDEEGFNAVNEQLCNIHVLATLK